MHIMLALTLLLQESDVDKVLRDFYERQRLARNPDETRKLAREAKNKFDAMVKAGTSAARASFHAGEMCLFLEDTAEALARFKAAVAGAKDLPKELLAGARFIAGELCLQESDPASARTYLGEFIANHADDERLYGAKILAEMSHAIEGKPDAAIDGLKKLRGEHQGKPSEWPLVAAMAAVSHFAERQGEARAFFEEIVRGCPEPQVTRSAKTALENHLAVGRELAFSAKDANGQELDATKLRGRVVVIYFYSIFEQRAPLEATTIRRAIRGLDQDVTAIGVCLDRRAEDFDRFRRDMNVTWHAVHEKDGYDGKLAQACGARGMPHLLILDRKGKVRFFNPFLTMAGTEIRLLLEKLVAEK
jgi:peroxiredoxin